MNEYIRQSSEKKQIEIEKTVNNSNASNPVDTMNSSEHSEKMKQGNMLLDIDFNILNKDNRGSSSFNTKHNQNLLSATNLQNVENKFKSSNLIDTSFNRMNNFENSLMNNNNQVPVINILPSDEKMFENSGNPCSSNHGNQSNQKNQNAQYSNFEKTLNSLAQVDLAGLLESINFQSNDNSVKEVKMQNNLQIDNSNNSNQTFNHSFDDSMASSSTKNKHTDKFIPIDFNISTTTKNNSANVINFSDNLIQLQNSSRDPHIKKDLDIFSNFENLLQIDSAINEDKFDKTLIKKQVRGVFIV